MGVIEPFEFVIHTVTESAASNSVIVRESGEVCPCERSCIIPASLHAGQPDWQPEVRQAMIVIDAMADKNSVFLSIIILPSDLCYGMY